MKRSRINDIMGDAIEVIARSGQQLPPFAWWTPREFIDRATPAIVAGRLGWDITDFGGGDFDRSGLFLFTLRNGSLAELAGGAGRVYAEKLLVVQDAQLVPLHTHLLKTKDLVNRWGATLALRLCGSDAQGGIDTRKGVTVECDGIARWVEPGGVIRLEPGESVTLRPGDWHEFRAEGGTCLIGEVSSVADDQTDTLFAIPPGAPLTIAEDMPPRHLLVGDYDHLPRNR
ncbi:MAG: D-lyxose/D-mannose family sugar isomerase [Paracoccus sp. (in: a-proteobacteria)]|uniref:D-lyxose/D-mannose family sugar isomerase n=1 Tax=Paracoccus sp. TaxID=267 RepID=UPI0026DFED8D|nr:D-lyxose/D-mannose family sugar isomerase [Paracoccus sp. (in: a-proteobacteria)]MDO5612208.1 D-lyxose/D-mannose family sugar isomerase [Paracoccus sp. (in: a-proteobacteria)]